jgi:membrane-associated phospholipid phosphatase
LILFIERDENAFNKQRQFIKSFWIWIAVGIYTITFKTFLFESIYNYIFNPTINNVVGSMQLNVWLQIIIYLISFGLAYGTVIFTLKLLKKYQSVFCDRKKEAIKMIIVSIVLLAFVGIMKMSITRERFRAIIFLHTQDMHNYFSVWYKDSAYSHDNIVPAEFNQSFPSGHVLINMNIFLLWFFIPKTNKRNKQITILKTLIIAIPTINCIGRLISGAHYLSDIGWSIIIGVLTILIVQIAFNYTAYKKKIKNRLYD